MGNSYKNTVYSSVTFGNAIFVCRFQLKKTNTVPAPLPALAQKWHYIFSEILLLCCTGNTLFALKISVADPYVFRHPGSGSDSQRYGSGYGSFYHQVKIVRKTFIPTVLWLLYDFLSLKNYVDAHYKEISRKTWRLEGQWRKQQDPRIRTLIRTKLLRIRTRLKIRQH